MDISVVDISVANTSVATLPWFAIRREQTRNNIMAQNGRTQFIAIGYIVWWYHTPSASKTKKRDRGEGKGGKGRAEGGRARRPQNSVAWLRSTDLWVMTPTR